MRIALRFILTSIIGLVAFTYLNYGETGFVPELRVDILALTWTVIFSNLFGYGIIRVTKLLRRILPWKRFLLPVS